MKKINVSNLFNSKTLFIIPNLLHIALFSYFYNETYNATGDSFEILYREILIMGFIFFIILALLHFLLKLKFNDSKIFFIKVALIMLSFEFVYSSKLIVIIITELLLIIFLISENAREKLIFIFSYSIVMLVLFNFLPATTNCISQIMRYKKNPEIVEIVTEGNKELPNIYWIHCDAMINFDDAYKYFSISNTFIKDYLRKNDFYINDSAAFESTEHTMQALVALYNPHYYDTYFGEYLSNIAMKNIETQIVSYDELTERRFNNELFKALKKKKYKLATISDFNQYASFYTDYMFDYYTFQKGKKEELKYFTSENNSFEKVSMYSYYAHLKTLADTTFLHYFTDDFNFLNYDTLNYNEMDYSNYRFINNTEYWKAKAILKSLDTIYTDKNENIFTFIDFSINHTPWLYNSMGKKINTNKEGFQVENFAENYLHSTYLLSDIIEYIKDNDENGVIILQGDHGIHTIPPAYIALYAGLEATESANIGNSTINAVYVPEKYRNGEEVVLNNPLNISRYLVNNFIGKNYTYLNE